MKKVINVVAAIIYNKQDQIYICQRSSKMTLPNFWEFPGGKIEDEETEEEALHREIKEELNCGITNLKRHCQTLYHYNEFSINLITYTCDLKFGTPKSIEHQDEKWIVKEEFNNYIFAAADVEAIEELL